MKFQLEIQQGVRLPVLGDVVYLVPLTSMQFILAKVGCNIFPKGALIIGEPNKSVHSSICVHLARRAAFLECAHTACSPYGRQHHQRCIIKIAGWNEAINHPVRNAPQFNIQFIYIFIHAAAGYQPCAAPASIYYNTYMYQHQLNMAITPLSAQKKILE